MLERLLSEIRYEIQQLDGLFKSYEELLGRVRVREPNLVETTAVASVLHSFYNGVENLFIRISKEIDKNIPAGGRWHRELLTRMAAPGAVRPAVISTELARRLADYLSFRHFYRHSYSFFLDWGELESLALNLEGVWSRVKSELTQFVESLDS